MYYHAAAIIVAMVELVTGKAVVVVTTVIIAAIVVVAVIVVPVLGVTRYCKYYERKLTSTLPNIKNNVRHLATKQKSEYNEMWQPWMRNSARNLRPIHIGHGERALVASAPNARRINKLVLLVYTDTRAPADPIVGAEYQVKRHPAELEDASEFKRGQNQRFALMSQLLELEAALK